MSRLGLKIFIIFLLVSLSGLLFTSYYFNKTIERGFTNYVYQEKKGKIEELTKVLVEDYSQTGWANAQRLVNEFMTINRVVLILKDNQNNIINNPLDMMWGGMMGKNRMMRQGGMMPWMNHNFNLDDINKERFLIKSEGRQIGSLYWYKLEQGPEDSQLADNFTRTVNRTILLAAVLVSLLTVIISYFFSRYITRPLLSMNEVAGRVAEGDFEQSVGIRGNDELAQLGQAFNDMIIKLRHLEKIRKESTSDLAHELRTPITTINSYIEGIKEGVISVNNQTIAEIEEDIERMIRLITRLGELSEAEKKIIRLNKVKIYLPILLSDLIKRYKPQAEKKNIKLSFKNIADKLMILGDEDSIITIFNNLLSNALKYTPAGGDIEVVMKENNSQAVITVKDTGIGIDIKDQPYIFERFYRTDKSRSSKTGGTGIGLTIARELIKAHKGKIEIKSKGLDKGTTFTVYLPLKN